MQNQARCEGRANLRSRTGRGQRHERVRGAKFTRFIKGKRTGCDSIGRSPLLREPMAKPAPAAPQIDLACADNDFALQMTRWLSHLRAERRLSPKTLEAYARDL